MQSFQYGIATLYQIRGVTESVTILDQQHGLMSLRQQLL